MFRFATSIRASFTRGGFAVLLATLLLQACGGGGGGDASPSEAETFAQYESRLATQASHYAVTEATADDGSDRLLLRVIDLRSGDVARTLVLRQSSDAEPYNAVGNARFWRGVYRFHRDLAQGRSGELGLSQLAYLDQDGHVMLLDLSGERLPEPRRVSTLQACRIDQVESLALDNTGKQGWMPVIVPDDASGECLSSTATHLVPLDGTPDSQAVALDAEHQRLLGALRDPQGRVLGVLLARMSVVRVELEMWTPDMSAPAQTVLVNDDVRSSDDFITALLASLPGQTQQSLVQVGAHVHRLDWRDGRLNLGPSLLTLQNLAPRAASDTRNLYLADGCTLHRLDADGRLQPFAHLPGDPGAIDGLTLTPGHVVVSQGLALYTNEHMYPAPFRPGCPEDGPPLLHTAVHSVDKKSGATTLVASAGGNNRLSLIGHDGDQVYTQSMTEALDGIELARFDLATGSRVLVQANAQLLTVARWRSAPPDPFDLEGALFILCTGDHPSLRCQEGDALQSLDPRTGGSVQQLGTVPFMQDPQDLTTSSWWTARGTGLTRQTPGPLLLVVNRSSPTQPWAWRSRVTPWLVTPGVADSLRELTAAP